MTQKILFRRDTAANWQSNNPTPLDGEVILTTDNQTIQVGWNGQAISSLPQITFFTNSGGAPVSLVPKNENITRLNTILSYNGDGNIPTPKIHPTKYLTNLKDINYQGKEGAQLFQSPNLAVELFDSQSDKSTITFGRNYSINGLLYVANIQDLNNSEEVNDDTQLNPHMVSTFDQTLENTFDVFNYSLFLGGYIYDIGKLQKQYKYTYEQTIFDENNNAIDYQTVEAIAHFDNANEMEQYVNAVGLYPETIGNILNPVINQYATVEEQQQFLTFIENYSDDLKFLSEACLSTFNFKLSQDGVDYIVQMHCSYNSMGIPYKYDSSLLGNSDYPGYIPQSELGRVNQTTIYTDYLKSFIQLNSSAIRLEDGSIEIRKPIFKNFANKKDLPVQKEVVLNIPATASAIDLTVGTFTWSQPIVNAIEPAVALNVVQNYIYIEYIKTSATPSTKKILLQNFTIDSSSLYPDEDLNFLQALINGVVMSSNIPAIINNITFN